MDRDVGSQQNPNLFVNNTSYSTENAQIKLVGLKESQL